MIILCLKKVEAKRNHPKDKRQAWEAKKKAGSRETSLYLRSHKTGNQKNSRHKEGGITRHCCLQ
jgi:hypothetical protein